MGLLVEVLRVVSGLFRLEQSAKTALSYQLWLEELGSKPEAVVDFLIEDMFIAGFMEEPDDIPELPWEIIELPAGSDTYSIIHIKAGELEGLGAVVSVREV